MQNFLKGFNKRLRVLPYQGTCSNQLFVEMTETDGREFICDMWFMSSLKEINCEFVRLKMFYLLILLTE